jgi:hypothetical protein
MRIQYKNLIKINYIFYFNLTKILPFLFFALSTNNSIASETIKQNTSPTRSIFVTSGKQKRLIYYWELDKNCEAKKGFNVRIEKNLIYGTIELKKTDEIISDDWAKRATTAKKREISQKCVGRQVTVISVYYTSNQNYHGFDSVRIIRRTSKGNSETTRDIAIAVR